MLRRGAFDEDASSPSVTFGSVERSVSLAPINSVKIGSLQADSNLEIRSETDSHADTTVIGDTTALVIQDFDRPVRVYGYDKTVAEAKCKTVSGVLAYDDPITKKTFMLVLHQALLIPRMKVNLISPMQVRDNDVHVNEEPKHMVWNPTNDHHAIVVYGKEGEVVVRIPLSIHGVTSYFPSRKPTLEEYEASDLEDRLELTYESPEWEPKTKKFEEQEESMIDSSGLLRENEEVGDRRQVEISAVQAEMSSGDPDPEDCFGEALLSSVGVTSTWKPTAKEKRMACAMHTKQKAHKVDAATLAKNWQIGLATAKRTVEATTQRSVRTTLHPTLSRRFRTNDRQLRYRRLRDDVFTDTMESKVVSWFRRNKYAQVFATRFGWCRAFPMRKRSEAHEALSLLARRDGVPPTLVMDNAREQTMGEFRRKAKEMGAHIRQTESHSPWQNAAEGSIRELKRGAGRKAMRMKSPKVLWDHCLELEGLVRSNTALDIYELEGEVPETRLSGQTSDISPLAELGWYDWVKFWDKPLEYPNPPEALGRWLGPALDIGPAMTCKILKQNGQVINTSTYRPLTQTELVDETAEMKAFDDAIKKKLGEPMTEKTLSEVDPDAVTPDYSLYEDEVDPVIPHAPDTTPEEFDNYVGAEVRLPQQGELRVGRVKKRARSETGDVMGTKNDNPILDTRVYEVEFPDGEVSELAANVIAENLYAQCDAEGNTVLLLDAIVDHKVNEKVAISRENGFTVLNGRRHQKKSTAGWKLCARWKDGSTSWETLADLKESFPIQVAEYAVTRGVEKEPAFSWWVPHFLKKRDRIISAVNQRYHKRTHKFGFEIPKTIKRAVEIDHENGNSLWQDAIAKEMANVRVAFRILEDGEKVPVGHQEIGVHMVFDVKLDGFVRKARLVAEGNRTDAPAVLTYASVVSRDTVRVALTIAALNDLEVKAGDVTNAFLTAPCEERCWVKLGPEFGPDEGKLAVVVRALYGLKSAGGSFTRHIADCMRTIGYEPCYADPDLWMKPVVRPDDGVKYYAYVLLYIDDCLCIHHDAKSQLDEIDKYFPMKPGSVGDPDIYLGTKLRKVTLDNGVEAWGSSPAKYIQEAVKNCEEYIFKNLGGRKIPKKVRGPWPSGYAAEMDESPELQADLASYYQSQIGILHWIVEIGRVDIITEVSLLASHLALPREGHLDAAIHVFAYLKVKHNSRLVFDPTYPTIDEDKFQRHNWERYYGELKEPIPPNAPEPRGKEVDLRAYVDSDHAGEKLTRRSRTGYFIFVNSALVMWLSKKQPTIESSVFGAEFVALKNVIEATRGLRYKLRMMGVEISGPTYVYGDNMSVIHNTQRPESTLKKKSNQICFHVARESVAMGESLTAHIDTKENPADLGTKIIAGGQQRDHLVRKLLFDICDDHEPKKKERS